MDRPERQLHHLEKIVVGVAVFAVLLLAVGFAEAAQPQKKKAKPRPAAVEKKRVAAPVVDPLDELQRQHPDRVFLHSSAALVLDALTGDVVFAKNAGTVAPIASITKLMTAIVVLDRGLDLREPVAIAEDDIDTLKGSRSRLAVGSVLTRDELLLLALMASENRAAAALTRTYPGGAEAAVAAMNRRARELGMSDSRFVDGTGLSSGNVSSPQDLVRLMRAAEAHPLIRAYSTRDEAQVLVHGRPVVWRNTNGLVHNPGWQIGLSKTGFIREAGRCLVMTTRVASKDVYVVLLDSWGRYSRIGDANRIRKWLETNAVLPGGRG